jgi:hypothetical protein
LDTETRAKKRVGKKEKTISYEAENKEDIEDEAIDKSDSETEDCIVVDVE